MQNSSIAVCTATFYPKWFPGNADHQELLECGDRALAESKIRGDLALETVQAILRKGYFLSLVDGAKGSAFQEELAKQEIAYHQEAARGMSASRIQAFDNAYDNAAVKAVHWIEPEKVLMVDEIEHVSQPLLEGNAAMIIPARASEGWNSLPNYQKSSEEKGNRVYNEKLRLAGLLSESELLDVYFGPRAFSAIDAYRDAMREILHQKFTFNKRADIPLHTAVNPGAYSEATFFPPIAALHRGLRVKSIDTRFVYPEKQRILEEHPAFALGQNGYAMKRSAQLVGILTEEVNYLRRIGRLRGQSRLERTA